MSDGLVLIIFFGVMLCLTFSGSTLFTSLGFTAVVGIFLWLGVRHLQQYGMIAYTQGTNFNQVIAPMFIMMSEFLSQGRIAEDIYAVLSRAVGKFKGGLAIATTLACTIFAALCGSSPATAASIGRISINEMVKRGYSPDFAVGTVAAGGTLGIMIPPSITFCFFGILTETSIVKLLISGILPGIMLSLLIIASIVIRVRINPTLINNDSKSMETPKNPDEIDGAAAREIMDTVMQAAREEAGIAKNGADASSPQLKRKEARFTTILPAIILIFVVLGSMYAGLATPIEAAGYGVIGSLVICILQRRLTGKMFLNVMRSTARTGTMLIFLVMCGFTMTYVISYLGIAQNIAQAITTSGLNRYVVLLILYVLWFILGMLMDPASVIILTIPFLFTALVKLGFDPLWIGVVSVLASQLAMITPPVGMNLFVLKANTDVAMGDIIKGSIPYVVILLIGLAILTVFPQLATILPNLMF